MVSLLINNHMCIQFLTHSHVGINCHKQKKYPNTGLRWITMDFTFKRFRNLIFHRQNFLFPLLCICSLINLTVKCFRYHCTHFHTTIPMGKMVSVFDTSSSWVGASRCNVLIGRDAIYTHDLLYVVLRVSVSRRTLQCRVRHFTPT